MRARRPDCQNPQPGPGRNPRCPPSPGSVTLPASNFPAAGADARMPRTLHNLQALRGLACLAVVCYHVAGWEKLVWPSVRVLGPVRWFGFAGVDLFFALSGFIITRSHLFGGGRSVTLSRYLFRRAWRIYPPYWAALVSCTALSAGVAGQSLFTPGWETDWFDWVLLVPRRDGCRFVPVAWSLNYELMFYLAFAGVFLVPSRAVPWLAGVWAVTVIAAKVVGWEPGPYWLKLPFSPFVLEFLGGAAAAGWARSGTGRGARLLLAGAGVWAVAALVLLTGTDPDEFGGALWSRVLAFGPPAVTIVYASAVGEQPGTIRLPGWLRPVGDASYSIYLFHSSICITTLFLTWGISHSLLPHLAWLAMMVGSGVGGGWVVYRLIERPLLGPARAGKTGRDAAGRIDPKGPDVGQVERTGRDEATGAVAPGKFVLQLSAHPADPANTNRIAPARVISPGW